MKLPPPQKIDKAMTYLLGGEALLDLMRRPKIIGVENQIIVQEEDDGTRILGVSDDIVSGASARRRTPCELAMSSASTEEDGHRVTFAWGRIANRQPTGFNTRGMIAPLSVANDGAQHYFYARATLDATTLQWVSAVIIEAAVGVANTTTLHYTLLGAAQVMGGVLSITGGVCGPIIPDLCNLANDAY